ncbi:MAG: SAM-dependent DNA methyltransferase, partial [Chloroflexi bacterium]|nr:SAM-dependent DNA methyltransferase [Chloroflexota bacterium]
AANQEEDRGRRLQESLRKMLNALPETVVKDRKDFEEILDDALKRAEIKLSAPVRKAVLNALAERDETAAICTDKEGKPEPDPELRDTERVPLALDVNTFFKREVKPHVPDAWIDDSKRDAKDGEVGIVGYEINFNRYFYRYSPPRPLEDIEANI